MMETKSTKPNSIFPLPMLGEELFLLMGEKFNCPMNFLVSLEISGNFDRPAFQKAVGITMKKHPLFSALHQGESNQNNSNHYFVDAKGLQPFIDWDKMGVPLRFPNGWHIDLKREVGIRFFIREISQRTILYLQVNHACCDGIGIIFFLKDFYKIYQAVLTSLSEKMEAKEVWEDLEKSFIKPLEEQKKLLKIRGDFIRKKRPFRTKDSLRKLKRISQFLFRKGFPISALAVQPIDSTNPHKKPEQVSFTFSEKDTQFLINFSKDKKVNLCSLLLRELFFAISFWNKKINPLGKEKPVRIVLPISFRQLLNQNTPATNSTGLLFFYKKTLSKENPEDFLWELNQEIIKSLKGYWGLVPLRLIRFFGKIDRLQEKLSKIFWYNITTIFTFLGDLEPYFLDSEGGQEVQLGELKPRHIMAYPPLFGKVPNGILALIYENRLSIGFNYNPVLFPKEFAEDFFSSFIKRLYSQSLLEKNHGLHPTPVGTVDKDSEK